MIWILLTNLIKSEVDQRSRLFHNIKIMNTDSAVKLLYSNYLPSEFKYCPDPSSKLYFVIIIDGTYIGCKSQIIILLTSVIFILKRENNQKDFSFLLLCFILYFMLLS